MSVPSTLIEPEPAVQVISLEKAGTGRLSSLDVFRGATIASMMLVNNPGTGTRSILPCGIPRGTVGHSPTPSSHSSSGSLAFL